MKTLKIKLHQKQLLNFLLLISILIILLNDFLLSQTIEVFKFGSELGKLLSNLSLAYISSFIFYYVVVVMKENRDKKNIYLTVCNLTNQLVGRAYSVYYQLISASGIVATDFDEKTITRAKFMELCALVNPKAIEPNSFLGIPPNHQQATHAQLIHLNSYSNVKIFTDKIFLYMPFLDTNFVKLINKLHDSTFFILAPTLLYPSENTDFILYGKHMYDYLELVRELDNYNFIKNKKLIEE
jgi:hypothetical protein